MLIVDAPYAENCTMTYPCRFDLLREDLPPLPEVAREIARLKTSLTKAGVPECFWRYDLPPDPRMPGILANNRGVNYWNKLTADQQRHIDSFASRSRPQRPTARRG